VKKGTIAVLLKLHEGLEQKTALRSLVLFNFQMDFTSAFLAQE